MSTRLLAIAAALSFLLCLLPGSARAQPPLTTEDISKTPVGAQLAWVLRCINDRAVPDAAGRFTDRFIELYTVDRAVKVLTTLRDDAFKGAVVSLVNPGTEPRRDALSCIIGNEDSERYLSLVLAVDVESGKIAGMQFASSSGPGGDNAAWDSFEGDMGKVQGGVWFGAYQVNVESPGTTQADARIEPVYEFGWRRWLNISHVSRAWVFGACARLVADGKVKLSEKVKGPDGVEIDLKSLMAKSASGDQASTDALQRFAGRADVEEFVRSVHEHPERNMPFLSQRECCWLKAVADKSVLAEFAKGGEDDRRNVLAEKYVDAPAATPSQLQDWTQPREIQRVGWFASNREAGYSLAKLAALGSQPGMDGLDEAWRAPSPTIQGKEAVNLDPAIWKKCSFLGGTEPGVMALAWLLDRDDGKKFALVLTWNNVDGPLEEARLYELANRGLEILAKEGRPHPKPEQ